MSQRIAIYTYKAAEPRYTLEWNHASRNHTDPSNRRIGAYAVLGHTVIAILWGNQASRFNEQRRLRRQHSTTQRHS